MNLRQIRAVVATAIVLTGAVTSCTSSTQGMPVKGPDKLAYWADPAAEINPNGLIRLGVDNLRDVKPQWSDEHFGVGTIGFDEQYIVLFGPYEKGNYMRATVYSRYDDSFEMHSPGSLPRFELTLWVLDRRIWSDA